MNYERANEYAEQKATKEFGADVMQKINERHVSSTVGKLSYIVRLIQHLTDFFETQKLAHDNGEENWLDEFHNYVKEVLEGKDEMQGLKKNLKIYFWNQEFKREPDKKRAIALFLKHYIQFIQSTVNVVTAVEFLNLPIKKDYEANYFNKEYVYGELLNIIEEQLK